MWTTELELYVNELLATASFRDYCPNGIQVQGRDRVERLVTGVTASVALLDAAIELGADAVLVHHGYFWKGENPVVAGPKRQRLQRLLAHDINLLAWHLPLDAHPELGNNAGLGAAMGWTPVGRFGDGELGWHGTVADGKTAGGIATQLAAVLGREPLLVGEPQRPVARVGWCTGAADRYFDAAIAAGVDLFVTGEASEPAVHLAREAGVAFIAAGHHATERFGVQALGDHLAQKFGISHTFVEIPNPV